MGGGSLVKADDDLLAANPELMVARRWQAQSFNSLGSCPTADEAMLVADPELMLVNWERGCWPAGQPGKTQNTSVCKLMGRKMQDNVEFVAYEPNTRLNFRSTSSSMPMEISHRFESTAKGTRLATVIEIHPGGFVGLAEPLLAANLRRWMETHFGDLKYLLESQATASLP